MTKLEELIKELCPDGVEYKHLGEVATISRGGSLQKKDYTECGIPCIHYGQIYTHYGLFADKTLSYISEETARKQKFAEPGDIVMAVTSENIDDVCKCTAWLGNEKVAVSGHTAIIHHFINPKYLVYWLHSAMFYEQKIKIAHGTKVIEIAPAKLADVILPVPPLPVQEEIVRILDSFTELTAELTANLTAEITARKKQYEYYRDSLLTFNSQAVQKVKLGDIASIVRGASPRPIAQYITSDSNGVNWIKIGDVKPNSKYITSTEEKITPEGAKKSRLVKKGDFILSNSMSFGRPYILKIDGCIHDGWLSISDFSNTLTADFLYHVLSSSMMQYEMRKKASFGGAVQNLNADIVRELTIPIPSLDTQNKIVQVLDNFDSICSDLKIGLPAEIEARKKQYEFYRDKLLSF